ncbi:MAG: SGNH/GDSL hydrolase family protein [Solidesulfovibrio sp. DCME]|uniref:SGNH/GDSL hydrolase family protein n=1 Tax=Solidesulfovibrio sp. DCME TaxID=3447380 RepID=UPI003D137229
MIHVAYAFAVLVAINALAMWGLSRLRPGRGRTSGMGALVALDAAVVVLLAIEIGMALFFAQSDGFNITMSSRNWFARHWHPVNALGYRDAEPAPKAAGEKLLVVLGDSFAAGHGIDRAEDRFGDVLARDLGQGWRVANVAKIGWDTVDEDEALRAYPVAPDVVVLAYFVNDIYRAAQKANFPLPFTIQFPKSTVAKYLVDHFALANFVYWRLARMGNVDDAAKGFWDRLRAAYADPAVWAAHEAELDSLVGWCREHRARLIALVIPSLVDVAGTAPMTAKAVAYFRARGVETVDLTPILAGRDPAGLVVNGVDSHANVALHAAMADLLRRAVLAGEGGPATGEAAPAPAPQ